jgi:hypothetical protein
VVVNKKNLSKFLIFVYLVCVAYLIVAVFGSNEGESESFDSVEVTVTEAETTTTTVDLDAFAKAVDEHNAKEYLNWVATSTTTTVPPTTTTTKAPQTTTTTVQQNVVQSYSGGSVWDDLAQCESSGNWAMNSGNGYYGGVQFLHSTWVNMGGRQYAEYPHQATREQQIAVSERLLSQYGWGQWPACSRKLGLR